MTASMLENELKTLPEEERAKVIRAALLELSPTVLRSLERQVRRLAHPEVPEDVWTGFEEAEEGRGIEIRDEHLINRRCNALPLHCSTAILAEF